MSVLGELSSESAPPLNVTRIFEEWPGILGECGSNWQGCPTGVANRGAEAPSRQTGALEWHHCLSRQLRISPASVHRSECCTARVAPPVFI